MIAYYNIYLNKNIYVESALKKNGNGTQYGILLLPTFISKYIQESLR